MNKKLGRFDTLLKNALGIKGALKLSDPRRELLNSLDKKFIQNEWDKIINSDAFKDSEDQDKINVVRNLFIQYYLIISNIQLLRDNPNHQLAEVMQDLLIRHQELRRDVVEVLLDDNELDVLVVLGVLDASLEDDTAVVLELAQILAARGTGSEEVVQRQLKLLAAAEAKKGEGVSLEEVLQRQADILATSERRSRRKAAEPRDDVLEKIKAKTAEMEKKAEEIKQRLNRARSTEPTEEEIVGDINAKIEMGKPGILEQVFGIINQPIARTLTEFITAVGTMVGPVKASKLGDNLRSSNNSAMSAAILLQVFSSFLRNNGPAGVNDEGDVKGDEDEVVGGDTVPVARPEREIGRQARQADEISSLPNLPERLGNYFRDLTQLASAGVDMDSIIFTLRAGRDERARLFIRDKMSILNGEIPVPGPGPGPGPDDPDDSDDDFDSDDEDEKLDKTIKRGEISEEERRGRKRIMSLLFDEFKRRGLKLGKKYAKRLFKLGQDKLNKLLEDTKTETSVEVIKRNVDDLLFGPGGKPKPVEVFVRPNRPTLRPHYKLPEDGYFEAHEVDNALELAEAKIREIEFTSGDVKLDPNNLAHQFVIQREAMRVWKLEDMKPTSGSVSKFFPPVSRMRIHGKESLETTSRPVDNPALTQSESNSLIYKWLPLEVSSQLEYVPPITIVPYAARQSLKNRVVYSR